MTSLKSSVFGAVLWAAPFAWADTVGATSVPDEAMGAAIVFLGEQHDNPTHHMVQAAWVETLRPAALVFEMLTPEQAARANKAPWTDAESLEALLDWNASGWPDFFMYYPIFAAAPNAVIVGAEVPRDQLRGLMKDDLKDVFGAENSARFGLEAPLAPAEQKKREDLQREAHCHALPDEMLPMMVAVQRLRDASLARAALDALDAVGRPVVVITGNGHARDDWGAPYLTRFAAPGISVFTLGQGEAGQMPDGGFGAVVDGPAVDRGDPCDAFN